MPRNLKRMLFLTLIAAELLIGFVLYAQQESSPIVPPGLTKAMEVMVGAGNGLHDITLQGNVEHIAGSTDENGSITLRAIANGSSRVDTSLPSGSTSESVVWSERGFTGQTKDANGQLHPTALHNLMTDSAWFAPALLVRHCAEDVSLGDVVSSAKDEASDTSTEHLIWSRHLPSAKPGSDRELQRLTRMDILIDRESSLPVTLTYESHPERNNQINFRVEVRYSDYQATGGIQIPMHIQRYVNGVLSLDIHITSAAVNSGLTASQLQLQ